MGKGEKMVQDFNGNTVVLVDALNNMNELDIDNEVFRIYSDESKNGPVKHWMDSDMISKLQKCEKCSTLHGLNIDEIEKRKDITTFDKEGIPENGHTTNEVDVDLGKEPGDTFNEHNASGDVVSGADITDNCLDCKSSELNGVDENMKDEGTYSDSLIKNNEISINTETAPKKVQAEYFRFGVEVEVEQIDIKDNCSGEEGDIFDHSNGIIELDINNPNLFSDFEDSDDDVFEEDIKRNTSLPPYLKFVSRRSKRPSKTHSESAILPDLSQRKEKPAQTVSDSAIVTALSKRNHKEFDSAARRKSVHFAIFPYVIEIPRVSDLEEEFLEAEREKYGKCHNPVICLSSI